MKHVLTAAERSGRWTVYATIDKGAECKRSSMASRLCHSLQRRRRALIAGSLATEPAASILQPIRGCSTQSRLQRGATPLAMCSAVCIRNQRMRRYSFTDSSGMGGWVGIVGGLIADSLPTKWSLNRLPSLAQIRESSLAESSIITAELKGSFVAKKATELTLMVTSFRPLHMSTLRCGRALSAWWYSTTALRAFCSQQATSGLH